MREVADGDRFTVSVLSWVAGYIDLAGYLKLNDLFIAHVTGNLALAGAEIVRDVSSQTWVRLAIIPVFMAAILLTTVFSRKRRPRLSSVLWFEAATLLIFMTVGLTLASPKNHPLGSIGMLSAGSAGTFSMGVQNALIHEVFKSPASTTTMTNNLTKFVMDLAQLVWSPKEGRGHNWHQQKKKIKQRVSKLSGALGGFVLGAICGAFVTSKIGFWSVLFPIGAIAFLALNVRRHETRSLNQDLNT